LTIHLLQLAHLSQVILQSKHQSTAAGVVRVTNSVTPGSGVTTLGNVFKRLRDNVEKRYGGGDAPMAGTGPNTKKKQDRIPLSLFTIPRSRLASHNPSPITQLTQ
jgi:hypothetical protein